MNFGEPDFKTPKPIREAAKIAIDEGFIKYVDLKGIKELRKAIADRSKEDLGLDYDFEKEILVSVGSSSALFCVFQVLLREGDEVLLPSPYYPSYYTMAVLTGAEVKFYTQNFERKFDISKEDIRSKISERTKALLLCYPNNPTGNIISKERLSEIANLAREFDLWVISDEVYSKFVYDGEHYSIASLKEMKERTIIINSASKSYGMTGWRIGWVLANEELIKELTKIHHSMVIHPDVIAQRALLEALKMNKVFFDEIREEYKRRRDFVAGALREMEGLEFVLPKGAFYFFPKFYYQMGSKDFVKYLIREAGVILVPGISFGDEWDNHIRITFSSPLDRLEEAMKRVKKAVGKLRVKK
ncbi:MAG: pyridoxal phosphate-dependent aminotransferase [Nitrososphaerales archaeon]